MVVVQKQRFIKELLTKLAEKHCSDMTDMTNWLRTKLSFSLLRSAALCVRGSRSVKRGTIVDPENVDMAHAAGAASGSLLRLDFNLNMICFLSDLACF